MKNKWVTGSGGGAGDRCPWVDRGGLSESLSLSGSQAEPCEGLWVERGEEAERKGGPGTRRARRAAGGGSLGHESLEKDRHRSTQDGNVGRKT